jgi:hypothetical protein
MTYRSKPVLISSARFLLAGMAMLLAAATVQAEPPLYIREGNSTYGAVIATVENGKAMEGNSSYGKVIANTDGGQMSGAAAASLLLMQ